MAVDASFIVALVMFFVELGLTIEPVRKFGLLNFAFGLFGIVVGLFTLFDGGSLPFHPYFSTLFVLVGILCLLRGTKFGFGE